jgi:general secretion pathway protein D
MMNKMKSIISCLIIILFCLTALSPAIASSKSNINKKMKEINFDNISVGNAARLISDLSGVNIIVTRAAEDEKFSMFLSNVSVKAVIDSLCRINNLWYRYNKETDVFMVMTVDEYLKELVVFRNEKTRIFTLRYQNVIQIARSIESLFGEERVQLTLDSSNSDDFTLEALDNLISGSGNNSSTGNNTNNRSRSSGRRAGLSREDQILVQGLDQDDTQLSTEQLTRLLVGKESALTVDENKVSSVTQRKKPTIFVTVNRQHNLLFVRTGDQSAMQEITRIIKESDRPVAQVLLEMKVLSIDVDDDYHWDFDLTVTGDKLSDGPADGISDNNPLSGAGGPAPTSVLGLGDLASLSNPNTLIFQYLNKNIRARLKWLQENGKVNVLSTPMLLSANNRASRLFVGEEAIITTGFTGGSTVVTQDSAVSSALRPETEVRSIGNSLLILPSINADRTVLMRVVLDNSTLKRNGGSIPVVSGNQSFNIPVDTVDTSTLEGIAIAGDGMTVAFGGMFIDTDTETESRVPVLSDIPWLGNLFTSTSRTNKKQELVLLITPHVFISPEEAEATSRERIGELSQHPSKLDLYLERLDQRRQKTQAGRRLANKIGIKGRDGYQIQDDFSMLLRFAHDAVHRIEPDKAHSHKIKPVWLDHFGYVPLLPGFNIDALPLSSWQMGTLYVTAVKVTNRGDRSVSFDANDLAGDWLSTKLECKTLLPAGSKGSQCHVYLISDRPFLNVVP